MKNEAKRFLVSLGCVVALSATTASAGLVTINFDSFSHLEFVDDQFLADGIDFNGSLQVFTSSVAVSGTKEALGPPFGPTPTRIDSVGNNFTTFGAWFRGDGPGDVITITAFDMSDMIIGTTSISTPPSGLSHAFLSIDTADTSGQSFAYVQITINAIGYALDDLQFAVVPLPSALSSAMIMLAIPLTGIALRRYGNWIG